MCPGSGSGFREAGLESAPPPPTGTWDVLRGQRHRGPLPAPIMGFGTWLRGTRTWRCCFSAAPWCALRERQRPPGVKPMSRGSRCQTNVPHLL